MKVEEYLLQEQCDRQKHLDLSLDCLERGGISTNHRGVLAEFLNTPIYGRPADLCHACHNEKCSNPRHLYWGTRRENVMDAISNGTGVNPWLLRVEKYGYEEACRMNKRPSHIAARGGKALKGTTKSEDHRKRISDAIKEKHALGDYKDVKLGRKRKPA